ncbi:MAG: XdhC family protein [Gammaproteobacteria bacterium]|jgi:xanthine dehydrogenase accessory factor|nr:XdhC family protein [Gammaproteobacteria bacterium]MBT4492764.1 XdhC family protein [Gammaproteobacteria bacterium]MBT7370947.1 XdhC family protein [Gammaproteobacteria bacterium]
MENADLEVLSHLADWVEAGKKSWLCTVVKTWGSSPRPVGSLLCCNVDGEVVGSLSGGCIEEDLLERLHEGKLAKVKPELLIYGATEEEVERFQLPCGGQLHVVIEPFVDDTNLASLKVIRARLGERKCVERKVDLGSGEFEVSEVDRFRHLQFAGGFEDLETDGKELLQTYGPRFQLFIIGAVNVSQYLAQMAQMLDYHVLVCDPREEMIEQWSVEGVQLVNDMPDDAVKAYADDSATAIVALTHDPRIDDMGLMEALKTDAFFVGAIGSTRTSAKRRERLRVLDLTDAEIDRLHGPVGLSIGSKTPAEIAIAILAQLTELRSKVAV